MELTELQKKKIREICWRAVKGIDLNINDRKVIEEGLYRAFTNEGAEGTQGPAGEDGKSAYELAVEQGYQGSLDEWLDSLQGQDGAPGANGINAEITECTATVDNTSGAPKVVVTMGGTSSKRTFKFDFTGLVGPQGAAGQDGAAGADGRPGQDGAAAGFGEPVINVTTLEAGQQATAKVVASGDNTNKVFTFTFGIPKGADGTGIDIKASSEACTEPGDAYIDENGDIQIWDGGQFNNGGQIRGPQGEPGSTGAAAGIAQPQITVNSVGPEEEASGTVTASGPDTAKVFKFVLNIPRGQNGTQGQTGASGSDGADGKTPQMQIGNVTTVAAGGNATASVAQDGTDDSGNPIYKINLGIPRGNTGANGTDGADGSTPNITIKATVDSNTGTPSVDVTEGGTTEAPVINLAFHNLKGPQGPQGPKGENGLDGEDASINLTQQMPGKVMFFPNSKGNEYRPEFNMNNASNAYFVDNVCQLRFSPGDSVVDGDGKVWAIVSVSNEGMVGTGGNEPAMTISLVPSA